MRRTLLGILGLVLLHGGTPAQGQSTNTTGSTGTGTATATVATPDKKTTTDKNATSKRKLLFRKKKSDAAPVDNSAAPDKVLYDRAQLDIKKGRHEVGRLNLQTLINTYPDSEYLAKAKLAIADSYFKEGGSSNLTQAIAGYKDFIVFFPFMPEAPYAQMQVAMTHYREMEKPDRDRTEARAAEEEFQTFIAKYPNDPLVPRAQQKLRDVQEILAEGDFRIGYYYYLKGDRRASAGRLISVTKRYPLYSRSDEALWMLGDIYEKSEKKEIASIYYSRIVRDYPLSARVADAKAKLVAFHVPVPQADPKALAWMQAEMSAPREHETAIKKPLALVRSGPLHEKVVAAQHGAPNMEPESDTTSQADILTGGGKSQIGAGGGNGATGNTAVVEVATPSSGASGGSTVESGDTGNPPSTPAAQPNGDSNGSTGAAGSGTTGSDPAAGTAAGASSSSSSGTAAPAGAAENQPATGTETANPANGTTTDGSANSANGTSTDPNAKPADSSDSKESTSKKKKGLKKLIPW